MWGVIYVVECNSKWVLLLGNYCGGGGFNRMDLQCSEI